MAFRCYGQLPHLSFAGASELFERPLESMRLSGLRGCCYAGAWASSTTVGSGPEGRAFGPLFRGLNPLLLPGNPICKFVEMRGG